MFFQSLVDVSVSLYKATAFNCFLHTTTAHTIFSVLRHKELKECLFLLLRCLRLDVYIHDYMLKRKMHTSAKVFMTEGKVATDLVAIDAPGGFLLEWWSVFWDIFIARTNEKHSEAAVSYIGTQQMKAKEQQMQMQQMHLMQQRNV